MNPTHVAAVVLRQIYLYAGSPQRILPIFAWVTLDILLWGFITLYLNTVANAGIDFVPKFLGAVLLWDFLTRVMQGVSMACGTCMPSMVTATGMALHWHFASIFRPGYDLAGPLLYPPLCQMRRA